MSYSAKELDDILICKQCDAAYHFKNGSLRGEVRCLHCHSKLYSGSVVRPDIIFALIIAAFFLFILAISFPFLSIDSTGMTKEISLFSTVISLFKHNYNVIGVFTLLIIFIIPSIQLLLDGYIAYAIMTNKIKKHHVRLYRQMSWAIPWSMMDVFLIGVIVTLVKILSYAEVYFGISFWAFIILVLINSYLMIHIDRKQVWEAIKHRHE